MTLSQNDKSPLSLEDARELIPWYLAGKLNRTESDAIDKMLKSSAELRDQLKMIYNQQTTKNGIQSTDMSATNLTKLLQQIEITKKQHHGETKASFLEKLGNSWLMSLPILQYALIAAAIIIIVQSILLYQLSPISVGSGNNNVSSVMPTSASLIVSFRPNVTTAQLSQILDEIDAEVIKGPGPDQTFILRLHNDAFANQIIARLQSQSDLIASAKLR